MRLLLIAVGRLKAGPERDLSSRYLERIEASARGVGLPGIDLREIPESRARRPQDRQTEEGESILALAPPGARLIVLDERGKSIGSNEFAADIGKARDAGAPAYALIIGGPDGLDPALRGRASLVLSFGAMTWPHQLARIMAAEQLYRAVTILAGHPYHRA